MQQKNCVVLSLNHSFKKSLSLICFNGFLFFSMKSLFLISVQRKKMAAGKAKIGHLAPDFTAKAVMPDGQFKDLNLSDYRGMTSVQLKIQFYKFYS